MTMVYMGCALFGGTVLICQTIMTLIGLGTDHDLGGDSHDIELGHDTDHGGCEGHDNASGSHSSSTWFFGIITFRTVIAAIAFFGIGGMISLTSGAAELQSMGVASLAGFSAMYFVHWAMRQLTRLRADGTVRIDRAIGMTGNVYLRVPAAFQGAGKIQLNLQDRTVELTAWTEKSELPTGSSVVVTRVIGPDSVEVASSSA